MGTEKTRTETDARARPDPPTASRPTKERPKEDAKLSSRRELYYAPESAVESIAPFIKDFKTIWDPAAGSAENYPLKDHLEQRGYRVVTSDILLGPDYDFFYYKTKKRFEIIVTTPPYSLRKEFIQRAVELRKPFALLVPVNVLESKTLRDLFKQERISLVFPSKPTSFIAPDDARSSSIKALPYCMWCVGGVDRLPPVVYL